MASAAVLAFCKVFPTLLPISPFQNISKSGGNRKCPTGALVRTLQDEYTPSFSSFLGRGEEQSCAFFTAIRADPEAAPEPSVIPAPPAPGPAGAEPAAPTAGEPCGQPAPSAMVSPRADRAPALDIRSAARFSPAAEDQTWRSSLFSFSQCRPIFIR